MFILLLVYEKNPLLVTSDTFISDKQYIYH